jgi:cell wall-associated NlpC family hydrolase
VTGTEDLQGRDAEGVSRAKPSTTAGLDPNPTGNFSQAAQKIGLTMIKTLRVAVLPRRIVTSLTAALFALTLALNPMSAPTASAAVSATVGVDALHVAAAQRGIPYRYGGASPRTGFDCSGLTMYSYARVGRSIPRVAQQQYLSTIRISARARRQGDLVFFYTGTYVYHVGIYAGGGYMIDAPHTGAVVRMERIWTSHVLYGRVR